MANLPRKTALEVTIMTDTKRTWIDAHIHVSDFNHDGSQREGMLAGLLDVLDRSGHDLRLVISPDGKYLGDIGRDAEGMWQANEMIRDLVQRAPERLYGSCMINPNFLDDSLRLMDKALGEWGFVQLGEMLQYSHGYTMDSDAAEAVVRHSLDFDVPVQVHIGTYYGLHSGTTSEAGMEQLADLIRCYERVPEAKYILAHAIGCGPSGEYIPWANMVLDTLTMHFSEYPDTFWVEIRDFQCPALPRTLAEVPAERLLSGTDWTTRVGPPFQSYGTMFDVPENENPFEPGIEAFVSFLKAAGASDDAVEMIGAGNAQELYRV
jgi:predicted TIM-barrel fold metal-dependent hydrolase